MNCCISLFFILANNTNLSGDWIYDFLNIKITVAWPVTCSIVKKKKKNVGHNCVWTCEFSIF